MMEETTIPATDREVPSSKEACDMAILNEPIPEKTDAKSTTFELHDHEQHTYLDTSTKNAKRPLYKLSKGDMDIGFKNKRVGRLISRRL